MEITKEKVLEAAEKCSEAKEVLETLFPEAFLGNEFYLEPPDHLNKKWFCLRYNNKKIIIDGSVLSRREFRVNKEFVELNDDVSDYVFTIK